MLQLRAYALPAQAEEVGQRLAAISGVRHLLVGGSTVAGMVQLTAEVESESADLVLEVLRGHDLAADDVTLWRASSVQPLGWRRRRGTVTGHDGTVWAEVMGRAHDNARLALTYLLYMAAAGVIAGVGVLTGSAILVVGAMALSPDLLPICATAVGVVERRWNLARRAFLTLVAGLATVSLTAAGTTALLLWTGRIDDNLQLSDTVLGPSLTSISPGGVLVALTAGMAGMMAYETAGSAAVGVAISVTTIPAAAYLGDALVLPASHDGLGALGVLATNIACMEAAGALTFWLQRHRRRAPAPQ